MRSTVNAYYESSNLSSTLKERNKELYMSLLRPSAVFLGDRK